LNWWDYNKSRKSQKPSIDDVFVHYTGEELRDAETEKGYEVSLRTRGH
jgi:ABC-2 type transport system ATP-binding protein